MSNIRLWHPTGKLMGTVELPASKSISNRYLIMAALAGQPFSLIENLSKADDTQLLQKILSNSSNKVIDVHNAGTCMRFLTAYYAIKPGSDIVLHGNQRMNERPIAALVDALLQLGADIDYINQEGYPPLRIKGKQLKGGTVHVDGSKSSQILSALALIAPYLTNGIEVNYYNIVSEKYLELTFYCMEQMGVGVTQNESGFSIAPKPYHMRPVQIESDWSAAAFFYAMVSVAREAEITLKNIHTYSRQPDAVIAQYMDRFEVATMQAENDIVLQKGPYLFENTLYNMSDTPDIVQPMSVALALKNLHCVMTDVAHLRYKETDRLEAVCNELQNLGVAARVEEDRLCIEGASINPDQIPIVHTYDDHRMAMAFAAAALIFKEVIIEHPEVVSKSFPEFWQQLQNIGFCLQHIK